VRSIRLFHFEFSFSSPFLFNESIFKFWTGLQTIAKTCEIQWRKISLRQGHATSAIPKFYRLSCYVCRRWFVTWSEYLMLMYVYKPKLIGFSGWTTDIHVCVFKIFNQLNEITKKLIWNRACNLKLWCPWVESWKNLEWNF
jgi:hypothetical protein